MQLARRAEGNEKVVLESEVKKLKARIAELECALGRKTVDSEILEAAIELAVANETYLAQQPAKKRGGG